MWPRYACAASLTIAQIAARSAAVQRRITSRSSMPLAPATAKKERADRVGSFSVCRRRCSEAQADRQLPCPQVALGARVGPDRNARERDDARVGLELAEVGVAEADIQGQARIDPHAHSTSQGPRKVPRGTTG